MMHEQCILAQLSILALYHVTRFIGLCYAVMRLLGIVIGYAENRSHTRHTCVALNNRQTLVRNILPLIQLSFISSSSLCDGGITRPSAST